MRWDDELLTRGYPAAAKRASTGPATSAGRLENTTSQSSGGSGSRTTRLRAAAGISADSRQAHASAYGLPCERSDPASAVTANCGWSASSWTNRWPTVPVAPRMPTRILAISHASLTVPDARGMYQHNNGSVRGDLPRIAATLNKVLKS